jgi:hypothetical protein
MHGLITLEGNFNSGIVKYTIPLPSHAEHVNLVHVHITRLVVVMCCRWTPWFMIFILDKNALDCVAVGFGIGA